MGQHGAACRRESSGTSRDVQEQLLETFRNLQEEREFRRKESSGGERAQEERELRRRESSGGERSQEERELSRRERSGGERAQ